MIYLVICFDLRIFYSFFVKNQSQEDYQATHPPIDSVCLLGCESWPDLSPTSDRYALRVFTPIHRQALPLSSALRVDGYADIPPEGSNTFATRLKRRASLLSLTSLGGLSAVCGRAVSRASGLLNEIILRLPDEAHYVEWSAAIRLAGSLSIGYSGAATPETIRRLFEAEKRATTSLLQLLTPLPLKATTLKTDEKDGGVGPADRMWLQKHFSVILPYRLAGEGGAAQTKSTDPNVPTSNAVASVKEEVSLLEYFINYFSPSVPGQIK